MELGVTTDSQDADGKVLLRKETAGITVEAVLRTLEAFKGERRQVPPMFSAVKYNGRPLYVLARKGMEVPRRAREVKVYELRLLDISGPEVRLRVRCSKGTYVRTLCADIGEALGCGGHLKELVRTRIGEFSLEDAVPLDELARMRPEEIERRFIDMDRKEAPVLP